MAQTGRFAPHPFPHGLRPLGPAALRRNGRCARVAGYRFTSGSSMTGQSGGGDDDNRRDRRHAQQVGIEGRALASGLSRPCRRMDEDLLRECPNDLRRSDSTNEYINVYSAKLSPPKARR
jgi:hypothetical protein